MHTLDWDDVRHFLQVVRSGSATRAAARLGINHTTVYRRIAALEDRLGKRIGQIGFAIYGTQALKQQAALDPGAEDLPCITWVGDGHTRPPWIEKNFPNTRRIYRTTTGTVMLAMARAGLGIARLACVFGDPDRKLQRIPAHYVEPGPALWVLSHVDLRTTARVRIFRDFLVEELEKERDLIEGKQP